MGAFQDLHELVNRLSGGNSGNPQFLDMHKEPRVAGAASATPIVGQAISLWEYEGQPSHGAVPPTSASYPTRATQGAWAQTNATGGRELWMPSVGASCIAQGRLVLYDRLGHVSGLSGTVTTAQTVNLSAVTAGRYTTGDGVWAAAEIYTQIGATATTIAMNYTNQAGTSGIVSPTVVFGATNNREAQRLKRLSTAANDTGVQAVASVTVTATTGTAGNFGIVLGRTLAVFNISMPQGGDVRSFLAGPLSKIEVDGCLAWYFVPTTVTVPAFDMWAVAGER